ncbi:hypothetical protein BaRGS_00030297 [Batillaria attramentaria]|uniref:Uncharacterized protein n=1 Tax=Batillaria attramentaria TaxID=370345 RepID=A0ABD0JUU0_9CAEN
MSMRTRELARLRKKENKPTSSRSYHNFCVCKNRQQADAVLVPPGGTVTVNVTEFTLQEDFDNHSCRHQFCPQGREVMICSGTALEV